MRQRSQVKKLVLAAILIAVGVVCSAFAIPIGASKCLPVQHMVNVIAGVILGPAYACAMAFITSLIRFLSGTGTLLAFPGSMVGALLCGILYKYTKNLAMAFVGETFGTGILGAILAWPVAVFLLGKEAAVFAYVVPFLISTVGGSILAVALLFALDKTGVFGDLLHQKKQSVS